MDCSFSKYIPCFTMFVFPNLLSPVMQILWYLLINFIIIIFRSTDISPNFISLLQFSIMILCFFIVSPLFIWPRLGFLLSPLHPLIFLQMWYKVPFYHHIHILLQTLRLQILLHLFLPQILLNCYLMCYVF